MVVCIWVRVCARACVSLCLFSLFFSFFVISILYENVRNSLTKNSKKKKNVALAFTSSCYCVRGTRTQPLISVGCSVLLISENLRFRLCPHTFASLLGACLRFASLWRTNSHGDSCVLGVHLSNVCWAGLHSFFVKRLSFKSLLKLRKAYIFQEFAEGLLSICVCWIFQSVHPSGKRFSGRCATKYDKSTEMWSSAAPLHHDLKYFWHRTN